MTNSRGFSHRIGDDPAMAAKLRALVGDVPTTLAGRVNAANNNRTQRPRVRRPSTRPSTPIPTRTVLDHGRRNVKASANQARATSLDLDAEIAKIQSCMSPEVVAHMQGRRFTDAQRLVIAGLIVAAKHPGMLVESDTPGWPLLAWHPKLSREGIHVDTAYARRELDRSALHARNLWLDSYPTFRGRCDESLHPELPVGYSTGAGVTGGE